MSQNRTMNPRSAWTPEQKRTLVDLWSHHSPSRIGQRLRKTAAAVSKMARDLGLTKPPARDIYTESHEPTRYIVTAADGMAQPYVAGVADTEQALQALVRTVKASRRQPTVYERVD